MTLLGPTADGARWTAMVKPLRKIKVGETIEFSQALSAEYVSRDDGIVELSFSLAGDAFDAEIAKIGAMPLPPYIAAKRAADARDHVDYQTIWAKQIGAVAARPLRSTLMTWSCKA